MGTAEWYGALLSFAVCVYSWLFGTLPRVPLGKVSIAQCVCNAILLLLTNLQYEAQYIYNANAMQTKHKVSRYTV